jgi:hypothetical protein
MKKLLFTILILLALAPTLVFANDRVSVSPAVIDEDVKARDIIQTTITVTNLYGNVVDIYPIVNNIDIVDGKQEFLARSDVDLKESLANWISISRGTIELQPYETREIPVTINVNLNAKPGKYHALISFMWGSTRAFAEENVKFGVATVVNVEVKEDIKERLQLGAFTSRELFFATPEVSFSYNLENSGNKDLVPKGEVRIYDRRGREVGSVPANIEGATIAPSETGQIASAWTATKKFGKYKAMLDIEYGSSQLGTVNDTIFFWVIPWKSLLAIFLVLATIVGGIAYIWWGRYERINEPSYARAMEKRRYAKHAGALLVEGGILDSFVSEAPSDSHVMDMRE